MPIDHLADPWSGTALYHGFSGAPGRLQGTPQPRAARRRGTALSLVTAGVAVALGLGAVFGLAARPPLDATGDEAAPTPVAAAPAAPSAALPLRISLAPAATIAPRAEPSMDAPAPRPAQIAAPAPAPASARAPAARPALHVTPPASVTYVAPPTVVEPPADAAAAEPAPTPLPASSDCAFARPGAEQMVCSDPALSDADRRLARAYRQALQTSGVPAADLRAEQQDWIAIREDAARHSPEAVASVYEQRIAELEAIAAGDDGE